MYVPLALFLFFSFSLSLSFFLSLTRANRTLRRRPTTFATRQKFSSYSSAAFTLLSESASDRRRPIIRPNSAIRVVHRRHQLRGAVFTEHTSTTRATTTMIVAFPLSLSPASSSATRKRKKKTRRENVPDATRARAAARLAASSIVPIVLLLLQSSSSCLLLLLLAQVHLLHAAFLCLPPMCFRIIYRFLRVRFPHRFALGRLLGLCVIERSFAHLVDDFVRSLEAFRPDLVGHLRRNDTQSSYCAFWALFFSSFKIDANGFPKDFVEEASSKSSFLPKTALATAKRQRAEGTKAHHRVRVVLRVVSSSTTHHHPL